MMRTDEMIRSLFKMFIFFCSRVIKEIAFMCGMVWKAIIVRLLTPVDFYDPLPSPDFFVLAELLVLLKCHSLVKKYCL